MKPDMWSGWGIRTLSTKNPSYNPNSYQNGAVWPHDNGLIAAGFRRYGFADEAARIARDISGAAGYFILHQMPELYSGLQRDPTSFPVQYLGANVPQAWAAGSCFAILQMIVGFQPDGPAGKLYIDPALPDRPRLPDLTIQGPSRSASTSSTCASGATERRRVSRFSRATPRPSAKRATPPFRSGGCSAPRQLLGVSL